MTTTPPTKAEIMADIPHEAAVRAFTGTSHMPEQRATGTRESYACTVLGMYEIISEAQGATPETVQENFQRFREGYRKRYLAYLHSQSNCVSVLIAGPSNFPTARMEKRNRVVDARRQELIDFYNKVKRAAERAANGDTAIMSGDSEALTKLDAEIAAQRELHGKIKSALAILRSKQTNEAKNEALRELTIPRNTWVDPVNMRNIAANIKRLELRKAEIERKRSQFEGTIEGSAANVEFAPSENRVRITFHDRPDAETIAQLKSAAFRWAPSQGAWSAYYNDRTVAFAGRIAGITE